MNPFKRQNKEIREFKLPAKMILFNGQVPQKGDIVQIDLGSVTKKARVDSLYFRIVNNEIIAFVHLTSGNSTYAVSFNTATGMMVSYWYDNSTLKYNTRCFDLYNEDTSRNIILSTKDINISVVGAFFDMNLGKNGILQVQYYDQNGSNILNYVSTLKAKNWTISEFDTYVYLPSIKGNYVTKEETLQNMSTNGTQLCTVTSERKEVTEVTDKVKYTKMYPQKRLNKLPNDTFSYDELYQSIEGSDTHRINVIKWLIRANHILKTDDSNHFIKAERFCSQKEQEPTLQLNAETKEMEVSSISVQEPTEEIKTTNEEMKQEKETENVEYKIFNTVKISTYMDYLNVLPDYFSREDLIGVINSTKTCTRTQACQILHRMRKYNYITYCNDQDHFAKTEKYRKNDGSLPPQSVTKDEEKPVTVTPKQEPQQLQAPIATAKPQPAKEDIVELGEKIGLVMVSIDIFSGDTNETRLQRLIDAYNNNVKKFSI